MGACAHSHNKCGEVLATRKVCKLCAGLEEGVAEGRVNVR